MRSRIIYILAFALVLAATVAQLRNQGRLWWCACGSARLWDGDIWCEHNSQHLFDPYSFTHVLHGVVFCGLTWQFARRFPLVWRLWIAVALGGFWEVLENTSFIINRYREATIGLGYVGDSITNSLGDILCCAIGFLLAHRFGLWRSVALFVVTELALLLCVRDNLTLNVLMLIYPIESIKAWQMIH